MALFDRVREHAVITSTAATLGWDQETYLPAGASEHRSKQLAWLSSQAHESATSDRWRKDLEDAEASDDGQSPAHTANLRELRRAFDRATRLPVELVAKFSEASSQAMHAWAAARERSDFASFAPHLRTLLELSREKAERWGYEDEPYDALLEEYERGARTAAIARLFETLAPSLRETARGAVARSASKKPALPPGPYPVAAQQQLNRRIAEAIGFDFAAGRIDITAHPFCTTLGPRDIRLTTRYDENDFTSSLFGVLHEAGHGLYEQGLPQEDFGLPSGSAVSLGVHESQSRLWENHVGRSRGFWEVWYPEAQETFTALRDFSLEDFMGYLHRSEFSPIRVEADEATYDLHILLRFDLERKLLDGSLAVEDVPSAWNESFRDSFGFFPPDDRHGCLQDIHWSMGGLGYFATYTLGNLNAAQLACAARKDPAVAAGFAKGDYAPLLGWLRHSVHRHGGGFDPAELIRQATGEPPSSTAYLEHLEARYLHS